MEWDHGPTIGIQSESEIQKTSCGDLLYSGLLKRYLPELGQENFFQLDVGL